MLDLEATILKIVEERRPCTIRSVQYVLFGMKLVSSMSEHSEEARISRVMTSMRDRDPDDEGWLDWHDIVDNTRQPVLPSTDPSLASSLEAAIKWYRRDRWQDQPEIVEVWSEKATVEGVLAPVLEEYGVPFRYLRGFGSGTAIKQALEYNEDHGKTLHVLYIGDWDPSGMCMSEVDLPKRIDKYNEEFAIDLDLRRIALLRSDLRQLPHYDLATKRNDSRYNWFVARYGNRGYELDALDPRELRARVEREIARHVDTEAWNASAVHEKGEIDTYKTLLDNLSAIHRAGSKS
jgi:hypothetical protein